MLFQTFSEGIQSPLLHYARILTFYLVLVESVSTTSFDLKKSYCIKIQFKTWLYRPPRWKSILKSRRNGKWNQVLVPQQEYQYSTIPVLCPIHLYWLAFTGRKICRFVSLQGEKSELGHSGHVLNHWATLGNLILMMVIEPEGLH